MIEEFLIKTYTYLEKSYGTFGVDFAIDKHRK